MDYAEQLFEVMNTHKKNKIDKFVQTVRQMKLDDIDGVLLKSILETKVKKAILLLN